MNYHVSFRIYLDFENIYRLLEPEIARDLNGRAKWSLKKANDHTIILIESKDSIALRGLLNSITKLLTVYEKTGDIQ